MFHSNPRFLNRIALGFWFAFALVVVDKSGTQSRGDVVPPLAYLQVFPEYQRGEYDRALREFRGLARTAAIRIGDQRWVDSICYHTMIGECYYHAGDNPNALTQYRNALELFLLHRNWMKRVQFPPLVGPSNRITNRLISWGVSVRNPVLANLPDRMSFLRGQLNPRAVVRIGGVLSPLELRPARVAEIVRCTALAMRRRAELMGPACRHGRLTSELLTATAGNLVPVNHWSQSWQAVLRGLAQLSVGKTEIAAATLKSGIVIAGSFDHVLTGTVLLELGKLELAKQNYKIAERFFLEASFSGALQNQADIVEESLRYGAQAFSGIKPAEIYPPLAAAAQWARSERFSRLHASLLVTSAENLAAQGQTGGALALANQAAGVAKRMSLGSGELRIRLEYLLALLKYQQDALKAADATLATALQIGSTSSLRLFQMSLVNEMAQHQPITPRAANLLFSEVLREPTSADWLQNPREALQVLTTPHADLLEGWFINSWKAREYETAFETADQIRRHRFFSTLPLGGRLLTLRWILEAPESLLTPEAIQQRKTLLVKYPAYDEYQKKVSELREQLSERLDDDGLEQRNDKLWKQLADVSVAQESILRKIAPRRDPADIVFPPRHTILEIKKSLGPRQLIISFFTAHGVICGAAISNDRYAQWEIKSPKKIRSQVAKLLRELGNYSGNSQLKLSQFKSDAWKLQSGALMRALFQGMGATDWTQFDELIIVPDGFLWYLPFDCLQVEIAGQSHTLIEKFRIRYAPTLSLAIPDTRVQNPQAVTAIVPGKIYNREPEEVSQDGLEDISGAIAGSVTLDDSLSVPPNLMAGFWDRLIVLKDIERRAGKIYDWSPVNLGQAKRGQALQDWLHLPWSGPELVVLPGFHTAAEKVSDETLADGSDVFLTTCALMATGSRTVLLSRWRMGGQTSYDLVREFMQEIPHSPASAAWRRSVQLAWQTEIDPRREPRLRWQQGQDFPQGSHPFLWSGMLLIDTGNAAHQQ